MRDLLVGMGGRVGAPPKG